MIWINLQTGAFDLAIAIDAWDYQAEQPPTALLLGGEAVGKRFGGVDIANGDDELAPAIALRRHAEG